MTHGGKTMKKNKNKKIVLASTIVLGLAAITSSALAAYIITGGENTRDQTVNPDDVAVDNKVTDLTIGEDSELKLNFASAKTEGDVNLVEDGENGKPDLTVTLKLNMEASKKEYIPTLYVTVTAEDGDNDSTQYVALPAQQTITYNNESPAWNSTVSPFTMDLTLTWSWGTLFGNGSPTDYYNTGAGSSKDKSTIAKEMEKFRDVMNATTYKVTITDVNPN